MEVKPAADSASGVPSVSVSRSNLSSFVSVRVSVKNGGTNTLNAVVVKATTTVLGASGAVANYAAFVNLGAALPNCPQPSTVDFTVNTVTCAIGQLASLETREFFLIFKMPTAGTSVNLNVNTDFSSGNSSSTPPADFEFPKDRNFPITLTTLDTPEVNKSVKTVLPPKGGTFFTGPNGQANAGNLFATSVVVPETTVVTDNRIDQAAVPSYACSGAAAGYFCYGLSADIEILNAKDAEKVYFNVVAPGKLVTIFLRQDAASLTVKKPTPSVNDVKIFYSATGGVGPEVPPCTAGLPAPDQPCVNARRDFLKGKKGYYEYEIRAVDNGRFSW